MKSKPDEPRLFSITVGEHNIRIADGVLFHNIQVVVCWRDDHACQECGYEEAAHHYGSGPDYPHDALSTHAFTPDQTSSLGVYPSIEILSIALIGRNGDPAKIEWRDEPLSKEQAKDIYSEGLQMGMELGRRMIDVVSEICSSCKCEVEDLSAGERCRCHCHLQ